MASEAAIAPMDTAHIALCTRCDRPTLMGDLCDDATAMQCPRCGGIIRPKDINAYELAEDER